MDSTFRLFALLLLIAAMFANVVSADALDDKISAEAKKYIMRGESASYFKMNLSTTGKTYFILQIDDKNSVVFDDRVAPVLNEAVLVEVLKDYYKVSGATGFTEQSKVDLFDKFNQSDYLFNLCHNNFYKYVEDAFFWYQFKCIDAATGRVCDLAFAQRARWKAAWDAYKAKVELLRTADTKDAIISALTQIEEAAKNAKNETIFMDDPSIGYRYFLGNTMDKDPVCLFDYSLVDDVISLSSQAMRNKITDVNSEAKEIIAEFNKRKDVASVKELQTNGRDLMEKTKNLVLKVDVKFEPIEAKKAEIETANERLQNATLLETASANFNQMNVKYGELEALINDPKGLFYAYNNTLHSVDESKKSIDAAKKQFGDTDTRVIDLNNKYVDVVKDLAILGQRIANQTEVKVADFQAIAKRADELRDRANTLPTKQSDLNDPTIMAAIVVLVASVIGVIIYVLKFRKKGGGHVKEMEIKTVMGSGGNKPILQREKVDSNQNKNAMFPKI
ncbi:MAG: hypothetical protein ABIG96_01530 [Candidatus Micrarchaeota archaeon]